ncbi:MAG TPA: hypothetical protein VFP98_06935 [Candidatus Polarisedimenticolia bacterium]|nr:hypothetical protein [Candidatus Polarisedimenticolia bacterium]
MRGGDMEDSTAGDVLGLLIGMIVPVVFVWQGVRMLIWPRQFLELYFEPFLETPPRRHFDGDGWASGLYWRITGGLAIVFGLVFFSSCLSPFMES